VRDIVGDLNFFIEIRDRCGIEKKITARSIEAVSVRGQIISLI
jgi:hypothetical protein